MADNRATLAAAIKATLLAAKAETDPANFDAAMVIWSNSLADAIAVYALALVPTGTAGGDPLTGGALT